MSGSVLPEGVDCIPIEGLESRWRACLVVPSLEAYKALVADLFVTARVMQGRADLAGHRVGDTHDCFVMNCRGLGNELPTLRKQAREARTKALEEVRAAVEQEVANVESCPHCSDHATARLRWVLAAIDKLKEAPTDER